MTEIFIAVVRQFEKIIGSFQLSVEPNYTMLRATLRLYSSRLNPQASDH